tara:strand:- start:14928 stop:15674 length:747 start_codon:yes stop_codon:yes gene_type:complete
MSGYQDKTKFVIVTPAFNCANNIVQTCISVIAQSYQDWRMVVYDDMSTDNTAEVVEAMSRHFNLGNKLTVIKREEKFGEVRNTIDAVQTIEDDEVVCRLDGGDWLTDLDTLRILDDVYRSKDPALVWTKHRWSFTNKNISAPLPPDANEYQYPWVSSHLKTFRKKSIDDININNFKDEDGNWIMIACDQAVFLPILHKARVEKRHRMFLPMVCYHYSIDLKDPHLFTCDRSLNQKQSAEKIRERGFII